MEKYTSVCILGFNSPEWVIANCAGIFAGGFATGIYPTNGPEACKYILDHSKCNILVVEDQRQLDKVWNFRNDLPNLKSIIQYTGVPSSPTVLSWKVRIINTKKLTKVCSGKLLESGFQIISTVNSVPYKIIYYHRVIIAHGPHNEKATLSTFEPLFNRLNLFLIKQL